MLSDNHDDDLIRIEIRLKLILYTKIYRIVIDQIKLFKLLVLISTSKWIEKISSNNMRVPSKYLLH